MLEMILISAGAVFGGTMSALGTIKLLGGFKPINDDDLYLDADEFDDDIDFDDLSSDDDDEEEEEEDKEEEKKEAPAPKKPVKNNKK